MKNHIKYFLLFLINSSPWVFSLSFFYHLRISHTGDADSGIALIFYGFILLFIVFILNIIAFAKFIKYQINENIVVILHLPIISILVSFYVLEFITLDNNIINIILIILITLLISIAYRIFLKKVVF